MLMVSWFHGFRGGVNSFMVSLVSWCLWFYGFIGLWCQGFYGFIGVVVLRVSWFYRFRGVNGFMVSMVSWFPRFGGVTGFMVSNPPRIPEFYTLLKIHKPSPVGRP